MGDPAARMGELAMRPEGYYLVTVAGRQKSATFEIRLAGGRISGTNETGERLEGSYFSDACSSRVRFSVQTVARDADSLQAKAEARGPGLKLKGEFDPGRRGSFAYRDGDRSYQVTVVFSAPLCHEVAA